VKARIKSEHIIASTRSPVKNNGCGLESLVTYSCKKDVSASKLSGRNERNRLKTLHHFGVVVEKNDESVYDMATPA